MHNQFIGKKGEQLAAEYYQKKGFTIIATNWRFARFEIDLIASLQEKIYFVEVKTRTNTLYGYPEESVTRAKFQKLQQAAIAYLQQNPQWQMVQYDVLSILLLKNNEPEFFLLEDFFC